MHFYEPIYLSWFSLSAKDALAVTPFSPHILVLTPSPTAWRSPLTPQGARVEEFLERGGTLRQVSGFNPRSWPNYQRARGEFWRGQKGTRSGGCTRVLGLRLST